MTFSDIFSVLTNPTLGAVAGALYGFHQRLLTGIRAGEVLNQLHPTGQNVIQFAQELFGEGIIQNEVLRQGLTLPSTVLRYLPGAIGSLAAIASARNWINGGEREGSKAQREMAIAVAVSLTVLPSLLNAFGYTSEWMTFDELAIATTQGMALYYGAQAVSLYGHKKLSRVLNASAAALHVVNFAYFSQQVYGFVPSPHSLHNLLTGAVSISSTLAAAKIIARVSPRVKTILRPVSNRSLRIRNEPIVSVLKPIVKNSVLNGLQYQIDLFNRYKSLNKDSVSLFEAITRGSVAAVRDSLHFAIIIYHENRAKSIEMEKRAGPRTFDDGLSEEDAYFNKDTAQCQVREIWNQFIDENEELIKLLDNGSKNINIIEAYQNPNTINYGSYLIKDECNPDVGYTFIPNTNFAKLDPYRQIIGPLPMANRRDTTGLLWDGGT